MHVCVVYMNLRLSLNYFLRWYIYLFWDFYRFFRDSEVVPVLPGTSKFFGLTEI